MNFSSFVLLLLAGSTRRSFAENYGDGAETSNTRSMLRRSDTDQQEVATKESSRDGSVPMAIPIGYWETGESIDQDGRNLAKDCGEGKKYFKLDLKTDSHGDETSWTLSKKQNNSFVKIAAGPPSGTKYLDDHAYIGGYCLSAGTFKFTIKDNLKDGMHGGEGGSYTGYVAGVKKFGSPIVESEWGQLAHEFSVTMSGDDIPIISAQFNTTIELTDADEKWLKAHNTRRKEWHKKYGKSYVPLQWSNALKTQSKVYARELLSGCGGIMVPGSTTYGENLASNVGTGTFGEQKTPEQILIRWFDREVDYEWPNNSHFTQVLWRATKYVGCDVASKPYKGGMCRTQVCRYARSGNCNMGAYQSNQGDQKWLEPMLKDDTECGPKCPPDGC